MTAAAIPERKPRVVRLSLRARLLLLVVASVVPLIALGVVREYGQYQSERDATYQGLLTIARSVAVAVERDLLLRTSALETLAMSPALTSGDFSQFDQQAHTFLARQPPSAVLGLVEPDSTLIRAYPLPAAAAGGPAIHTATAAGHQVFDRGMPVVTDLHTGHRTGLPGFSIDVPVFRNGRVAYDLFLRLRPSELQELLATQHLPPDTIVSISDTNGVVVARVPNTDQFVGHPIVPALMDAVNRTNAGIARVSTLEGIQAIAAFTHANPPNWVVTVGAPESVVFAPVRSAILRTAIDGLFVLCAGMTIAIFAARGITGPIANLRRLAEHSDNPAGARPVTTGLAETDTVAQALIAAADDRRAAAEALAESEQRFRDLFERSPSGMILADPDTTEVVDSNDAAAAFVGYTRQEFRGVRLMDLRISSTAEHMRNVARSVINGQIMRYEAKVRGRQGPRDLFVAVGPIRISGRSLMLISQIDVTDLRRAETDLRVNQERLELAREGASLGIWEWDVATDKVSWSEHEFVLHGMAPRPDSPTPAEWWRVVVPADTAHLREELRRTVKEPGHLFATEYSVQWPDGTQRRLLARGQAIRDETGRTVRLVGINMDVTARHDAELARDRLINLLEAERSRLTEIIDVLPVAVGIVDPSGRFVLSNAFMRQTVGPIIPSMDDAPHEEWIGYHPDGRRIARADYPARRALLGEATLPGQEFLYRAANGTETWFRIACMPLRSKDGTVREALVVMHDIDAERRLVEIQRQANARLEQRVREEVTAREAAQMRAAQAERVQALGQIAGGIAHDFNNVLQAVSGGAALIERRPDNPERVVRHARMVADAARRGAAITSRLLAFARRGDLRAESVDAGTLLHDMANVLSHTLGGTVRCEVEVAPGLPPLFADRGQLETVLVNLATNARDAMPSGGVLTMSAGAEVVPSGGSHPAGLTPGAYIRISVCDTGTGMDEAVLIRVTEPFFTTKEPGKGTGLGLAMAKGFVEQSGGRLLISSKAGSGTTIDLWLPQADKAVAGQDAEATRHETTPDTPCVLLVDDDPIVRDVLTASLEEAGYVVLSADSGAAALPLLRQDARIQILVSDLTMPVMDGLSLIREAQAIRPGLPAILLTGYAGDGAALAFGGAISGAFSLLRKPVTGVQLVDRISGLLESSRLQKLH